MKTSTKGVSTRDRILEAARAMFNRDGVHGVAVFRVAEELSISPGNITYYFKSKADIVAALSESLASGVEQEVFGMQVPLAPNAVISHLEAVLRTLWQHRFLFNSALDISQIDARTAKQVRGVQASIGSMLRRYFEETIARGEMRRPSQEDGVGLLSENVLSIWLHWLRTSDAAKAGPDPKSLRQCMRHHFSLIDPYMGKRFAADTWTEIDRRYRRSA